MRGALVLGGRSALRSLIRLQPDRHGQPQAVKDQMTVAIARCADCGHRCRVLPSDVLPGKIYSLSVIEHLTARYIGGDRSLRQVAWSMLGERTPQHTTLHGWTEGLGAHVLGRDTVGGESHAAMVAETAARWSAVASVPTPSIAPRRYRSEARRERLLATSVLLLMAATVPIAPDPSRLCEWRRLAIDFGIRSPLSFRSGRSCTAIGQVGPSLSASCRACPTASRNSLPSRTRSPPGDSSRSRRSSTPPSDTPPDDA